MSVANDPALNNARIQPVGSFVAGKLESGYHMDLRGVAGSYGTPEQALAWLDLLTARREQVMPVTVLQLGLGAWQRSIDETFDERDGWAEVASIVAQWAVLDMDAQGRFVHHRPMPHTYEIEAGWHSAMAQALGVSLLVRTGWVSEAARALVPMIDPQYGLVTDTKYGPILEEYPANPRPHVLNGWIWALFGVYDYSITPDADPALKERAAKLFAASCNSLVSQLDEYQTGRGWSTYDRYPHPIANIASPFYHRLHVDMLRALDRISPHEELLITAGRWEAGLVRPVTRVFAVARKVGFRLVKPRGKAA